MAIRNEVRGTLFTGTGTGASTDSVQMERGDKAIVIQVVLATTGTVAVQASLDGGTTYTTLPNGSITTTSVTPFADVAGLIRVNVTANGSGASVHYGKVQDR